ncbi:hypothetical protein KY289_024341 [Solanum tuberosum]|nr:hypothetical protein KY289_024341 [Solanum tuberosum]
MEDAILEEGREETTPSFTETTNLNGLALMLFPEMEDKMYIYKCPPNLKKCSIDFRHPFTMQATKAAVVLIPTLRTPSEEDIIRTHNPCILALLETRLQDHSTLKEDLNFNGILQVPAVGRVGGTVLLWHDNLVVVNQVRNSNHELHAMVQGMRAPDTLGPIIIVEKV